MLLSLKDGIFITMNFEHLYKNPHITLNIVEILLISARCIFFSGSHLMETSQLSVLSWGQSRNGWPPGKFSRKCVSEDKTHWKDLWWFVGIVFNSYIENMAICGPSGGRDGVVPVGTLCDYPYVIRRIVLW